MASEQAAAQSPRVEVRGLTKVFRTGRGAHMALDNVSLTIAPGEFQVLLGPSGCGKTTLLRCVAGLEAPDAGEIVVDGRVVFSTRLGVWLPPEKRRLSMVFQSYALWPHLSVFENIAYPLRNIGCARDEIARRVAKVTALVGLDAQAQAYPGQLSGGQQQRVALARAIVWDADVVLFDEPLSNLDAKVRERLRVELLKLQTTLGFSALYVTHDQVEAMALADRIVVMRDGSIAQIGRPAEIYGRPVSRYVADFVGSANEVRGTVTGLEGGFVRLDTPLGPLHGVADAPLAPGQAVVAMFRPHHCRILGPGETAQTANVLEGRLGQSHFLGAQVDHVVMVRDVAIVVSDAAGTAIDAGATVRLGVAAERVLVFPGAAVP